MRSIGRDPIFLARGAGSKVWDVDGNEYVDWISSWGPLILGHAEPSVIAAVIAAAQAGTTFGAPTEGEVELAAEITYEDGRKALLQSRLAIGDVDEASAPAATPSRRMAEAVVAAG